MNANPSLEDAPCALGCAADARRVLIARDELYGAEGEFMVVRCNRCGLMRTSPRPTPQAIGAYYPESYSPYLTSTIAPARTASPARSGLRAWLRGLIRYQTEEVPALPPGRLLEIGCASGAFLQRMQAQGWAVEGLEFSATAAERARAAGLKVQVGTVEKAQADDASFDLVVGWMVLEHLHDPVGGLRKMRAWAKPGGWLCLSVPNAGALEFRLFGRYWYALQVPTHLSHFTAATLRAVLEAGGWQVERVLHHRTISNLVGSLGIGLRALGAPRGLYEPLLRLPERSSRWTIALYPIAWLLSHAGQTGRMTVWARRR